MIPKIYVLGLESRLAEWAELGLPDARFDESHAGVDLEAMSEADIVVFAGHGYDRDDWSFGGDVQPQFRWSDYEGRFAAALIVFATCYADRVVDDALRRMPAGHVVYAPRYFDDTGGKAYRAEMDRPIRDFLLAVGPYVADRSEIAQCWVDTLTAARRARYGPGSTCDFNLDIRPLVYPSPEVR